MSVTQAQDLVRSSYLADNKVVLEPLLKPVQALPFMDSQILKPDLFRVGILQLNQVLMAHPTVNLNYIYDPIVSVTEQYVDFDGFARFGHSYCKIRFPEKLFEGGIKQEGRTNVDFNPSFIRSLRQRSYNQNLWLYIDPDGVDLAFNNEEFHLKKIKMPNWWSFAYKNLRRYVNLETMEIEIRGRNIEEYYKVILSGKAFQQLVQDIGYSYTVGNQGVRSLQWYEKSVDLLVNNRSIDEVKRAASINLITSCEKTVNSWGVWRINNLSDIAPEIIQADVYVARKEPSFWVLHARSGIQMLLGYTPYTGALWTEKARAMVDELLKNPYGRNNISQSRRRRRTKSKNKSLSRQNFVENHPGQRKIPDFVFN